MLSVLCLLKNVVFCWFREAFMWLCTVYAVMNEFMQINFSIKLIDKFYRSVTVNHHNARNKLNFVQFCNTASLQEGVENMGFKLYNKAPSSIKNGNFKLCKQELKSLLLSHSLYSVDKFLQFWEKLAGLRLFISHF
jgi:hypothetical protein